MRPKSGQPGSLSVIDPSGWEVGFPGWRATPPGRPAAVCLRVLLAQLVFTASCHVDPPFLPLWSHASVVPSGQLSGHNGTVSVWYPHPHAVP